MNLGIFRWVAVFSVSGLFLTTSNGQIGTTVAKPETVFALVSGAEAVTILDPAGRERRFPVSSSSAGQTSMVAVNEGEILKVNGDQSCDVYIPGTGSAHLTNEAAVRIPPKASPDMDLKMEHSLELLRGKLLIQVDGERLRKTGKKQFRLKTPSAILAVKGTRFFAEATDEFDTLGVNEGNVAVLESSSGRMADLREGFALAVKPGAITPARRLTPEEEDYGEWYDRYGVNEIPGEGSRRDYTASFQIYDPATQETIGDEKLIKVSTLTNPDIEGKILKFTMKPHVDPKTGGHGDVRIYLNDRLKLKDEPVGVSFFVRSTGMSLPGYVAMIGYEGARYGRPEVDYKTVPGKLDGSEWIPVIVSVTASGDSHSGKSYLGLTLSMTYRENDLRNDYLAQGLEQYSFEISPITLLTRGK